MERKQESAITLIALVVTIVVLLILAGISIAMLAGEDGIIKRAQESKIESNHGEIKERVLLEYNEYQLKINTDNKSEIKTFFEFLLDKNIIDNNGIIKTEELLGNTITLGKGSEMEDVYKIVKENNFYKLSYYKNENEVREIEKILIKDIKETKNITFTIIDDYGYETTETVPEGTTWGTWIDQNLDMLFDYDELGIVYMVFDRLHDCIPSNISGYFEERVTKDSVIIDGEIYEINSAG